MGAILDLLQQENYTFPFPSGDVQVIVYDPKRVSLFPEGYLSELFWRLKVSRLCALQQAFCNMTDLSHDAVTAYLHTRKPLLILGVWKGDTFDPAGFAFFPSLIGEKATRKAFGAYAFFQPWWGTPQIKVLGVLGLAYFFREFGLHVLIGERYASNDKTAHFMAQFGFRDVGVLHKYFVRNGKLVPGIISELLPEEFERAAELILDTAVEAQRGEGVTEQPQS